MINKPVKGVTEFCEGPNSIFQNCYYMHQFNQEELEPVLNEVRQIQSNFSNAIPHQNTLAGNLKHEYRMVESNNYFEKLVLPHVRAAEDKIRLLDTLYVNTEDSPIIMGRYWVNFQRKHEFNPPHSHAGVYSLVLWVDIPYDIEDEMRDGPGNQSNMNCPGHFAFHYPSVFGSSTSQILFPVDKKWNGRMAIFPASLVHEVYPFYTSDDYRITISANFYYDVTAKWDIMERLK